jgi:NAD(P)-dependent dehydrogenase (short-subunit alcohol dehydrogenase family)
MAPKAVVTAGTRGLDFEAAQELSRRGYPVTIVGRDPEHGEEAVERIGGARFVRADLSVLAWRVRALGARLAAEGPLPLLVNNSKRRETADGIEATFALNHITPIVQRDHVPRLDLAAVHQPTNGTAIDSVIDR